MKFILYYIILYYIILYYIYIYTILNIILYLNYSVLHLNYIIFRIYYYLYLFYIILHLYYIILYYIIFRKYICILYYIYIISYLNYIIVASTINHSYWSYVHQLSYRTGASHCTIHRALMGSDLVKSHVNPRLKQPREGSRLPTRYRWLLRGQLGIKVDK